MTNEETIFAAALTRDSAAARAAYLDDACAGNVELRRSVEALLLAHERPAGILESPLVGGDVTSAPPLSSEPIGSTVGPYKLLEQIGGGGMGIVYMAEQLRPIRRKVALKIIKPGMDSGQVIARFEAERQALAMMDHANIAKVFDAGTTDAGRPYFVMELVKGIPITDYCDQARLTTRQRLELFVPVCQAVQHAHQKGVIHRDLKPTNVLVTLHDDKPVPKVIDFGIAKAAAQVLTERTLFTNYAQMLGTPLYMSPEQAQISGTDVDTRSDVYSLGVLLYELLTGTTPFDKQRLRDAAYDEMRRIIREEDPPKPSTRLSTLGDRIASVSAQRKIEPRKLGQLLDGELDWIVMRALEKDRTRRYETANGLGRDVERHLNDEAVHACPPSAIYRFRKFARRNKGPLLIATAALASLLVVLVGLAVSNRLIATERNEKAKALVEKEQALALAEAQNRRADANFARALLSMHDIVTRTAVSRTDLPPALRRQLSDEAATFFQRLIEDGSADPAMRYQTGVGYRTLAALQNSWGEYEQAESSFGQAVSVLDRLAADFPADQRFRFLLAYATLDLSRFLHQRGRSHEAEIATARATELFEQLLVESPDRYEHLMGLARVYIGKVEAVTVSGGGGSGAGSLREGVVVGHGEPTPQTESDFARAAELLQRAAKAHATAGPSAMGYITGRGNPRLSVGHRQRVLGFAVRGVDEAEQAFRQAADTFESARNEDGGAAAHFSADCHRILGLLQLRRNMPHEAEREFRRAIEIHERRAADSTQQRPLVDHLEAEWSAAYFSLAEVLMAAGRLGEAAEAYRRGLEIHPSQHQRWYEAAGVYLAAGDDDQYRGACRELLDRLSKADAENPELAERTAKACSLSPESVADFRRVERLADLAVKGTEAHRSFRLFALGKGLVEYRAGRHPSAIQWVQRFSPKPDGVHFDAVAFSILAMAHDQLGENQHANAALKIARSITEGKSPASSTDERVAAEGHDWLHAQILCREAEKLLTE